ncbi:superinfection immunity protein [Pseudomonas simiae]|nr:superinfection immunity protein [Pseudomonas simiae]WLI03178.1 superinfection immunity protein [Pseudomonas simiae]
MKVLGLLILAAIALYFYPTICAAGEHPRSAGIFALNLLAGWTFVGGVALLSGRSAGRHQLSSREPTAFLKPLIGTRLLPKNEGLPVLRRAHKAAATRCRFCGSDLEGTPA